jgi:hypothetical protein
MIRPGTDCRRHTATAMVTEILAGETPNVEGVFRVLQRSTSRVRMRGLTGLPRKPHEASIMVRTHLQGSAELDEIRETVVCHEHGTTC